MSSRVWSFAENRWRWGFCLLPVVCNPFMLNGYEVPRTIAIHLWVLGMVILAVKAKKIDIPSGWRWWLLFLWWTWLIVCSVVNQSWAGLAWGNWYRGDGLGLLSANLLAVCFMASFLKNDWWRLLAGAGLVAAFFGFLSPHLHTMWPDGSMAGTFGNPHILAGFLTVSLVAWFRFGVMTKSWQSILGSLIVCISLYLTHSWLFIGF